MACALPAAYMCHLSRFVKKENLVFNSFLARLDFCHLLLTVVFANSLDPDQNQQNVGPDLDPNSLTL